MLTELARLLGLWSIQELLAAGLVSQDWDLGFADGTSFRVSGAC